MKFADSMDRRRKALDEMLKWLKDQGEYSLGSRNQAVAENETEFELGVFDEEKKPPFDDDRRDGFVIRTRREALTAQLNSADILKSVGRMEKKVERIEMLAGFAVALALGSLLNQIF